LCCTAIQRSIAFGISPLSAGSGSSSFPFVFSCIFTVEEFDRIEDRGSQDITIFDAQTHLEFNLNMSLRPPYFTDKALFSGKKQNFQSWVYSPQVPDYQDF
jgi:hypothetical protein